MVFFLLQQCATNFCASNLCASRDAATELCVKGGCEEDGDCLSGRCIYGACATGDGEVEGGCPCLLNRDCKSGDCDHKFTSLDYVCEFGESDNVTKVAELCKPGSCERDEDCESGFCIWDACAAGPNDVEGGCPCQSNSNCKSGDCDTSITSLDWVCEFSEGEPSSTGTQILFLKGLFAATLIGFWAWIS